MALRTLMLLGTVGLAAAPGQAASDTAPFPSATATYPNVPWPLPQHMTAGTESVALATQMALSCK